MTDNSRSSRRVARPPGPNHDGCPFCGALLSAQATVERNGAERLVLHCPSDGDLVLEPDLVAALPTLAADDRAKVHDYLLELRRATHAVETLSLRKIQFL